MAKVFPSTDLTRVGEILSPSAGPRFMWVLKDLIGNSAQKGRVEWLGIRPERRAPMIPPRSALFLTETGIEGDRFAQKPGRSRQVTLFQAEHLPTIAAFLGRIAIAPEELRRNVMISGINVLSLRQARFRIGAALLEGTGHCHPCSRLEETLGFGGYNATRGLAGITARILEGAEVGIGDEVELLDGRPENG